MTMIRAKQMDPIHDAPATLLPPFEPETSTGKMPINSRRALAESILGPIEWIGDVTGYGCCPGVRKHTTTAGERDCRVKIDGVPTIHCVHASCAGEIELANIALRGRTVCVDGVPLTSDSKRRAEAKANAAREGQLRIRAEKSLPAILKNNTWAYDRIATESPIAIDPKDRQGMVNSFLTLFETDDVIWIGDGADTGKVQHADHFKTKAQWLESAPPEGPLVCPACFNPGSVSRSKDNVITQRYLVVESDLLKKDEVGAIFCWLDQAVKLPLCAVVDTAGKSLHGWFEYPEPAVLAELRIMLPAMGCDPKMFGASQPCRLPGGLRDGRIQRLIYFAKGGTK